ncbi:sensor histidine kinase [Cellulophaga lytica]|uniref:histidine kinase n=1 Tax=Cellulophaga lytica (strain ATCC 23178 / DSM 7489 / JCM 8516 / NBRC 14961 / NCIMB 1423 / VKM B-1433 / Cy l20) TaxID=867900 RepID=F0RG38_CELLC|nr:ATP-binding protein [Cellulophaga lytica]ADY29004.1 multi-sensor signal transduction histidine kinase [Cellulophaga lytica DSM 7489]AIM60049.1 histidine kinase [Cellulophaga lytica]MDO6854974.1 ATP-binding protein [Cellulophaga lytica]WQG76823.1 ATP-binding protein [Cellulophaga lytica]
MASKSFYFQLVLRVVFITLSAVGLAYFGLQKNYIVSGAFFIALILLTVFLINYVNHTNRKIAYFFQSIKNEDFTLRFPEYENVKSLKELNRSLNMLNAMIHKIHVKNQVQEKYYQEILKHADIGILTINDKGHILFANPRVEHLLNYKPLNHIKQLQQVDTNLYNLFAKLEPFQRKLIELTNERERIQLTLKSTTVTLDNKNLLLVVVQDIQRELEEKEADSWEKLIRVLTHEIMNTIAPITSISESILNYYKKEDGLIPLEELTEKHIQNTSKGLAVVKEQGNNLMDFVQSYRSFLSIPAPDKSLVKAEQLIHKVFVLIDQENQNTNINFASNLTTENLAFFIDEKQITQVLLNLCKNAVQSIGEQENGNITVTAGITDEKEKFITVADNGPGIPPELIDEIFIPFFTTKNTGTGIGLSLSKQILRLHGGSLKLRSTPNHETVFTLLF